MKNLVWIMLIFFLSACSPPSRGSNWILIGKVSDGPDTFIVEVNDGFEKSKSTFKDAVDRLCSGSLCRILFFGKFDKKPPTSSMREFISSGGLTNEAALAVWSGPGNYFGEFMLWNCERAGVVGAPLGALCGEGVREDFLAVNALASRAGMQRACQWEPTNDMDLVANFLSMVGDVDRRRQYEESVKLFYGNGYNKPDDLWRCPSIKLDTQPRVDKARIRFGKKISTNSENFAAPIVSDSKRAPKENRKRDNTQKK